MSSLLFVVIIHKDVNLHLTEAAHVSFWTSYTHILALAGPRGGHTALGEVVGGHRQRAGTRPTRIWGVVSCVAIVTEGTFLAVSTLCVVCARLKYEKYQLLLFWC